MQTQDCFLKRQIRKCKRRIVFLYPEICRFCECIGGIVFQKSDIFRCPSHQIEDCFPVTAKFKAIVKTQWGLFSSDCKIRSHCKSKTRIVFKRCAIWSKYGRHVEDCFWNSALKTLENGLCIRLLYSHWPGKVSSQWLRWRLFPETNVTNAESRLPPSSDFLSPTKTKLPGPQATSTT